MGPELKLHARPDFLKLLGDEDYLFRDFEMAQKT